MNDATVVDGMEDRFTTALSEVTDGYGIGDELMTRFAPAFGAVALAPVFAGFFSLVVDFDEHHAEATRMICLGLVIMTTCIYATVVGRRRRRTARRAVTPAARIALEGIRIGSIRHLSRHRYECLSTTLGERAVVEAIQASPREVAVL